MPVDLAALVAPGHTALVLQECQEGVIGKLSVLPALAESARVIVPNLARLVRAARAAKVPVVHCLAVPRADGFGRHRNARLFRGVQRSDGALREGGEGVKVAAEIGVEPSDVVLTRMQGLTPFGYSELDPILRNEGIRTIVAVGVSVNVAITAMTFEAVTASYQVVIPRDAVAGVPREYADAVLDNTLALLATVTKTDEVLKHWAQG